MSTKFLLIPTASSEWTDLDTNFHIDIQNFSCHLQQRWPITIPTPPTSTEHDFEWQFATDGSLWLIYYDRRIIRFWWDAYALDFILWYRAYIPITQQLFLVFEGGGQLALTAHTTAAQLVAFSGAWTQASE
jgi:hypothetical protein